jgi:hypothetical protein
MSPIIIIAMNNTRTIHRPACQNRAPYYALAVRLPTHIILTTSGCGAVGCPARPMLAEARRAGLLRAPYAAGKVS